MTEALFSEKRTRSQLTLPDDILQIPDRSPLKDARTALRNHTVITDTCSSKSSDDNDDELLLSPGKNESHMFLKAAGASKRSASPPPQDEYSSRSGSPLEGRELKRAKWDGILVKGAVGEARRAQANHVSQRRLVSGHARNHSDSNVPNTRRSGRKRSATTSKKPISTASASPPPSSFSPVPGSPRRYRAHSVPLFLTGHDIPRIDLRNPPPSPKRSQSRSRSPAKDKPKLRITSATFVAPPRLPTIQDEVVNNMHIEVTSNVPEQVDMEISPVPETTVTLHPVTTIQDKVGCDTDLDEVSSVPEEMELEIPPIPTIQDKVGCDTDLDEISSVPEEMELEIPPVPCTTVISHPSVTVLRELPLPAQPTSTVQPMLPQIPATPATQSLNRLIPMSPLTPVPETPMPPRVLPGKDAGGRYVNSLGWGLTSVEETPRHALRQSTSQSRLPRLSMGPSAPPFKTSGPGEIDQPPSSAAASKKAASTVQGMATKRILGSDPQNAFALMMKSSRDNKHLEREGNSNNVSKLVPPKKIMPTSKGGEAPADPWSRMKMKDKMRPKVKSKSQMAPLILPMSDDEEERDTPGPSDATEIELNDHLDKHLAPRISPAAIERPLTTLEIVDVNQTTESAVAPLDTAMADIDSTVEDDAAITLSQTIREGVVAETLAATPDDEHKPLVPSDSAQAATEERKEEDPPKPVLRSKASASKLPLGKKRQPISIAPASRVTRSVSNRKKEAESEASTSEIRHTASSIPAPLSIKRTASGAIKKPVPMSTVEQSLDVPMNMSGALPLPPGSPMRLVSPAKQPKTPVKTPANMRNKFSFDKPASSPSPTKIARSSSYFSLKPASSAMSRSFSMDNHVSMGASSSLSTLSNALEKLRMPAPSRPNTSMGFNRESRDDDSDTGPVKCKDDGVIGRKSSGVGLFDGGMKRASVVGASASKVPSTNAISSSSKSSTADGKSFAQRSLTSFMSNKVGIAKAATDTFLGGTGKASGLVKKAPLFGVGGGLRRKVSKKTSLPMVIGSPVKGGGASEVPELEDDNEGTPSIAGNASEAAGSSALSLEEFGMAPADKGKGKEETRSMNASRRVSMVSHALSVSLNALPPPSARGLMGPPAMPSGRSAPSTHPPPSEGGSESSPSQAGLNTGIGTRSSARIAQIVPPTKIKGGPDGHGSYGRKGATKLSPPPDPATEALKFLKDCVIFVDVRTDDGQEAGSFFSEMLEDVGARVLTRVGQTCTHIVYKNGLMSTLTRYRLLRDPKPLAVGIAWVVECVEQRKRVDETDFLVDLDGANVAGVNKRRRSMIPKLFATDHNLVSEPDKDEAGDQSMDGSNSSITMDDDLAPLERARRRKSIMIGRP